MRNATEKKSTLRNGITLVFGVGLLLFLITASDNRGEEQGGGVAGSPGGAVAAATVTEAVAIEAAATEAAATETAATGTDATDAAGTPVASAEAAVTATVATGAADAAGQEGPADIPVDIPASAAPPDEASPQPGGSIPEPPERVIFRVPATPPVELRYFDDALFIGDSRVMGLMLYSGLTEAAFYTEKGLNAGTLLTKPIVPRTGGGKETVPAALSGQKFGKIYIKIGLNELGWPYPDRFIDSYGGAIDQIREMQPDAVFYVMSILPVSAEKEAEGKIFQNQRITEFNGLIEEMCREKGLQYLDVYDGLTDENGFLPETAGSDGIHLNKEYCQIWLEYLRRHTFRDYYKIRL